MICNSSPLIFLSKIGELGILRKLFVKIKIPSSVKEEVLIEDKIGSEFIREAIEEGWIKVEDPKKIIELSLGKGENSVISLGKENEEVVIIDDLKAIKIARSFGLKYSRTTTIILEGVKRGVINKKQALESINKLIEEGYYIAPRYFAAIFSKLN